MSQRRLFSPKIVQSDAFLDMPISTQALYFHLGMEADDDGFVNPKKTMRVIGASDDDLKVLLTKRFVLSFKSGVIVIKHWLIHNSIRLDRYHETMYTEEKNQLFIKENKAYTDMATNGQPIGRQLAPQVKLSKAKLSEVKLENTPSQIAKDFFLKGKRYSEYLSLFGESMPQETARAEFDKFILYWTELNGSGLKQKWQLQQTFDVKKRLYTWLSKMNSFNKTAKPRVVLS